MCDSFTRPWFLRFYVDKLAVSASKDLKLKKGDFEADEIMSLFRSIYSSVTAHMASPRRYIAFIHTYGLLYTIKRGKIHDKIMELKVSLQIPSFCMTSICVNFLKAGVRKLDKARAVVKLKSDTALIVHEMDGIDPILMPLLRRLCFSWISRHNSNWWQVYGLHSRFQPVHNDTKSEPSSSTWFSRGCHHRQFYDDASWTYDSGNYPEWNLRNENYFDLNISINSTWIKHFCSCCPQRWVLKSQNWSQESQNSLLKNLQIKPHQINQC